ncbi:bifunctional metallophosphatase/5'-nucleotidase [Lacticaseibacillus kribbianus]|uniref:bifunctional metallophosphatase/5'-nucleotidase n=1 Tax=Lacticaseibacillus kribbianus TaxID=2926292 RepID=UPI001CD1F3A3|nr:bifunctional metallophosphatase/5'-nucleotidase [Lacticaseibacillus kribbianus]
MQLTILSTSDTHGFVTPTNYVQRNLDLPFSLSKAKTVIDRLRQAATGPVLTIENGDFVQGSPLAYYAARVAAKPELETAAYNTVGYDLGILGNHEFNYGRDYLSSAVATLDYPVLCANILDHGDPAFGAPYRVFDKAGVKIAVLGLTTDYIPHWEGADNIRDLSFEDVVETAKAWVPRLHALADVVVIAYHGGFERDLETGEPTEPLTGENVGYALTQIPGVDALVTGHQHRELAGVVNGVPTTQPGYRGADVGVITLTLEETATGYRVTDGQAALESTAAAVADPAVLASVAATSAEVEDWLDAPLGQVVGDMRITDPFAARVHEHPYIELINRVQMAATGTDIAGTALFNNEGRGFGAAITMRDVVTNYIYPNTLAVVELSGADLKAALEQDAEYFSLADGTLVVTERFARPKPQHYNYDMYHGIDYTLDISQPVGRRVVRLDYHGQPVRPDQKLEVTVNQYRAAGGGDFAMFDASKVVRENQKDMTELIADYLRANPVIQATTDDNFTVLA